MEYLFCTRDIIANVTLITQHPPLLDEHEC